MAAASLNNQCGSSGRGGGPRLPNPPRILRCGTDGGLAAMEPRALVGSHPAAVPRLVACESSAGDEVPTVVLRSGARAASTSGMAYRGIGRARYHPRRSQHRGRRHGTADPRLPARRVPAVRNSWGYAFQWHGPWTDPHHVVRTGETPDIARRRIADARSGYHSSILS